MLTKGKILLNDDTVFLVKTIHSREGFNVSTAYYFDVTEKIAGRNFDIVITTLIYETKQESMY